MGIMDMFSGMMGGAQQPPQQQQQQQQQQPSVPGNLPGNAASTGATNAGAAPNGALPTVAGEGTAGATAAPLDQFADIWKNDPNAATKPQGVFGEIDPKKFTEAAGRVDFSKVITPDQLTAITSGGEGAMQAFATAMNSVAQNVYAQSAFASTKIVEQAVAKAKESLMAELPQHIRNQTASESLRAENPIFSHPAAAPILGAVQSQLAVKFPQATSAELAGMAKQYLEHFATGISSTGKKGGEPEAKSLDTDWSTFLS